MFEIVAMLRMHSIYGPQATGIHTYTRLLPTCDKVSDRQKIYCIAQD